MVAMAMVIDNGRARHMFLERQGLSTRPDGRGVPWRTGRLDKAGLMSLIETLGFVQVDSIATVERAHHQILFSRNPTYRRADLTALLETDRQLFEHWTHDASILPSAFFPYWKHRFRRDEQRILASYRRWREPGFEAAIAETYQRIAAGGPVLSRELKGRDPPGPGGAASGWWNWHPSKTALEFLWRSGRLAITARDNFQKIYDLTERVIPAAHHAPEVSPEAYVDWACREALRRLGFATPGEIAAFWNLVKPEEAKAWVEAHRDELQAVEILPWDGGKGRASFALAAEMPALMAAPEPPGGLRVLSPFDPLIRNRDRMERLFGFFYRIEVFVPEARRTYGYYVFPLLEGDRLIGRIDMKANRRDGLLSVRRLWLEPGIRPSRGRLARLDAELHRLARFTGVDRVDYGRDWLGG